MEGQADASGDVRVAMHGAQDRSFVSDVQQAGAHVLDNVVDPFLKQKLGHSRMQLQEQWIGIRAEFQELVAFTATLYELYSSESLSLFLAFGVLLAIADLIFMYGQFHRGLTRGVGPLPFLRIAKVDRIDDVLSDMPRTVWILAYCVFYKLSVVGVVTAVYNVVMLGEDAFDVRFVKHHVMS